MWSASIFVTTAITGCRCRDVLGIRGLHGARYADGVGTVDELGLVLQEHFHAEPAQAVRRGIRRDVRAAHLVAEVAEHFRNTGHAVAADPDEMQAAYLVL